MPKKQVNLQLHPITRSILLCLSLSSTLVIPVHSHAETASTEQPASTAQSSSQAEENLYAKLG